MTFDFKFTPDPYPSQGLDEITASLCTEYQKRISQNLEESTKNVLKWRGFDFDNDEQFKEFVKERITLGYYNSHANSEILLTVYFDGEEIVKFFVTKVDANLLKDILHTPNL